jgi:hypothetical protein
LEIGKKCDDGTHLNASSAETFVVTAYMTCHNDEVQYFFGCCDYKISEQRSSEAEARARRAMATEEKDSAASADENLAKKNAWYKKLKNSC